MEMVFLIIDIKNRLIGLIQRFVKHIGELKSPQIIMGGYAIVILVGTLLLVMPFASVSGKSVGLLDALFTATSATCVTGLMVYTTAVQWTIFGKIVILLLIQIGGMGFMCLVTMLLVVVGKKITLKERLVIQQSLNQNDIQGMVKLVKNVVIGTFLMEGAAAILLGVNFYFKGEGSFLRSLWIGFFHSVSAFNNAGIDLLSHSSATPYIDDALFNIVVMVLIVLGGLGYTVWLDVIKVIKKSKQNPNLRFRKIFDMLTLHTKIVIEITVGLIIFGAIFFFIAEYNNPDTIGGHNLSTKILASFFQSVTPRTAGFSTFEHKNMILASQFMTIILMFIGGSPGGTAGGVKTVTIGVLFACILSVSKGKAETEIHHRSISIFNLMKSLAVILMNIVIITIVTMLLTITERNVPMGSSFFVLFFETTSAVGTVGLTMGITPYLSSIGKILIILCMYYGRVGPITVAVALMLKQLSGTRNLHYAEEKIFVG